MLFSNITNIIENFRADPVGELITLVYLAVCILFSLIIHECAHGYVALKCGDPTAKMMGRLTLDPRKHLDPIGTICMIFLRFGWAKPVPVNPRNFHNYKRDYILVSLAGIITNLLVCLLSLLISAILSRFIWSADILTFIRNDGHGDRLLNLYQYQLPYEIYIGSFKNIAQFSNGIGLMYIQRFFLMLAQMNLALAVFNFLPVPPLDGYRFLEMFVFRGNLNLSRQMEYYIRIGFLLICMSGLLSGLLGTINSSVFGFLSRIFAHLI